MFGSCDCTLYCLRRSACDLFALCASTCATTHSHRDHAFGADCVPSSTTAFSNSRWRKYLPPSTPAQPSTAAHATRTRCGGSRRRPRRYGRSSTSSGRRSGDTNPLIYLPGVAEELRATSLEITMVTHLSLALVVGGLLSAHRRGGRRKFGRRGCTRPCASARRASGGGDAHPLTARRHGVGQSGCSRDPDPRQARPRWWGGARAARVGVQHRHRVHLDPQAVGAHGVAAAQGARADPRAGVEALAAERAVVRRADGPLDRRDGARPRRRRRRRVVPLVRRAAARLPGGPPAPPGAPPPQPAVAGPERRDAAGDVAAGRVARRRGRARAPGVGGGGDDRPVGGQDGADVRRRLDGARLRPHDRRVGQRRDRGARDAGVHPARVQVLAGGRASSRPSRSRRTRSSSRATLR